MDNQFGIGAKQKNQLEDESSDNDSEHYRQKYKQKSDDSDEDSFDDINFQIDKEDLDKKADRRVLEDQDDDGEEGNEPQDLADTPSQSESNMDLTSESASMIEPFDFNNLPPHACAYCGIHDTKCVV